MKMRILIGCSIVMFLTLMMPMVHPLQVQTVTNAREQYIDQILTNEMKIGFTEGISKVKSVITGSLFLKILKIKWILFIIFKLAFLPIQLLIQKTVKKVVSPLKIILAPFWITGRLLLYTLRFITAPIRMILMPLLTPIILLAKLISIPFKIFDIILFILFPFKHPLIDD